LAGLGRVVERLYGAAAQSDDPSTRARRHACVTNPWRFR